MKTGKAVPLRLRPDEVEDFAFGMCLVRMIRAAAAGHAERRKLIDDLQRTELIALRDEVDAALAAATAHEEATSPVEDLKEN